MSRRIVAPVLLLVSAALSIAAVFVVHDIEAEGGPLSEPSAVPPFFSPNGDDVQDVVKISFTTKHSERVSLRIEDDRGLVVRTLLEDARVDGEHTVRWDGRTSNGRVAHDGTYRAVITRLGDPREYQPTEHIVLDTKEPRGVVDRATLDGDRLTGLVLLEPNAQVVALDMDGDELESRTFAPPNPEARSVHPSRDVPRGMTVYLWLVELGTTDVEDLNGLFAQDLAGNRLELHANVARRPE